MEGTCENHFREKKVQNEFRVAEREGLLKLQLQGEGTLRQCRPLFGGLGGIGTHRCSALGLDFRFTTNHPNMRSLTSLSFSSLLCERETVIVPTLQGCGGCGGGNYMK